MDKRQISMELTIVGSDDGKETYEVCRRWNVEGKGAVIIELYPTISTRYPMSTDISTMHLVNHISSLGWNEVRIINLYPFVFDRKPSVGRLRISNENLEYIRDVLSSDEAKEMDIVIAWGSSLKNHQCTEHLKKQMLNMIVEYGLQNQVKHIVADSLDTEKQLGTHPLYLGLRCGTDIWELAPYPMNLPSEEKKATDVVKGKKKSKKEVSGGKKEVVEDVLPTNDEN